MLKLTLEQEELLSSLLDNKEELKVLLLIIEDAVKEQERHVNTINISSAATERELVYRRCRAEGARKLILDIRKILKL